MDKAVRYNTFNYSIAMKVILAFIFVLMIVSTEVGLPPEVVAVEISSDVAEDLMVTVQIVLKRANKFDKSPLWGYLGSAEYAADIRPDEWVMANDDLLSFSVSSGEYNLFLRDDYGNVTVQPIHDANINKILSFSINYDLLYLPLEDTRQFAETILSIGDIDTLVKWQSSDSSVASVDENGLLKTHRPGTATISAIASDGQIASATVVVSDLFNKPELLATRKERLPAYRYSEEEAHLLDDILAGRIREVGYGTRAGVVEAARFLTLEFPYYIPYFFENGRLNGHGLRNYVDGEGRYYKVGLYLSVDKYESIIAPYVGPAIWGAPLRNFQDEGYFKPGGLYPNGLDCSGFISWTLLNGGFDVGDVGAGDYYYLDDDLCDLGTQIPLNMDTFYTGRVKVGDLIGEDGHIAIIIGLYQEYVYIAESTGYGVHVEKLRIDGQVQNFGIYDYIMLMDSVYGEDGDYTPIWENERQVVDAETP